MNNYQTKINVLKNTKKAIQAITVTKHTLLSNTAICFNMRRIERGFVEQVAGGEIRRYISKVLGVHGYLHQWIARNRRDFKITPQSMKDARIAWIDWMIAEYEKKLKKA